MYKVVQWCKSDWWEVRLRSVPVKEPLGCFFPTKKIYGTDIIEHVCVWVCVYVCACVCMCVYMFMCVCMYVCTYRHTHTYTHTETDTHTHTHTHTYIHVLVAEWLAWLTSNCGRIGAIGSSPSNGLRPNMWGQKGFNPLCQCVYIYVCIVKPDIQTIHRCSHTSIHTYNIYSTI